MCCCSKALLGVGICFGVKFSHGCEIKDLGLEFVQLYKFRVLLYLRVWVRKSFGEMDERIDENVLPLFGHIRKIEQ